MPSSAPAPAEPARIERAVVEADAASPGVVIPERGDWVWVPSAPLAVRLPAGWRRMSGDEVAANREEHVDMKDEAARRALEETTRAERRHTQIAATEAEPSTASGPMRTVQIVVQPLPPHTPRPTPGERCARVARVLQRMAPDFTVSRAEQVHVGALEAIACDGAYTLSMNGKSARIAARALDFFTERTWIRISVSGAEGTLDETAAAVFGSIRPLSIQ